MKKGLFIFIAVLLTWQAFAQERQPNVIFILADDLGINALHCYGNEYVESPNIDKLFKEGMHFMNGYSNDPTCAPSRASILSGQYVSRHHVYRVEDRFEKDEETLVHMKYLPPADHTEPGSGKGMSPNKITIAETLQSNGYLTAAFGKWHLGRNQMDMEHQGFDQSVEITGHYGFTIHSKEKFTVPDSLYSSDYITDKGISFIKDAAKGDKPFFLYLPYYLVHKPLQPKATYLQHFKEKYANNSSISTEDLEVLAMIKSLDESVGQVLQAVKELNLEENTIIIFASDNGHYKTDSELFNKPYRGFKGQTLEGGIRVPYIFKWKGKIAANATCKEPIIHIDLYPTIAGLTHSKKPTDYVLDGEDISPVLLGKTNQLNRRALIWEYTNYARYNEKTKEFASTWVNVIQKDGFKMTEDVETGNIVLFNLNNDPYEAHEVSKVYPDKLAALRADLKHWKTTTGYELPRPNPKYVGK